MSAPLVTCWWSILPHPQRPSCFQPRRLCQCGDPATLMAKKHREPGNESCEFCWRHEWAEQPSTEYPEIEC